MREPEPHACPKCRDRGKYLITWASALVVRCRYCGHIFHVSED